MVPLPRIKITKKRSSEQAPEEIIPIEEQGERGILVFVQP
jgi:hypothetical protein